MNPFNHAASGLALLVALTALAGCSGNNFALVGRDTLSASATQTVPDEFVATVDGVILDTTRFIFDQSESSRNGYSAQTRVMYLGRAVIYKFVPTPRASAPHDTLA